MTATAALMPLTAPMTLTRKARSQSSVLRLWMRPLGESTPALLMSTSTPPKRSTASATTASTCSNWLDVSEQRGDFAARLGKAGEGRVERRPG